MSKTVLAILVAGIISPATIFPAIAQQVRQPFSTARPIVQYQLQTGDQAPLSYAPPATTPVRAAMPPVTVSNNDLDCMTKALVFEAVTIDFESLLAVGTVIANRASARSSRWPSSWCGVVAQRKQFSSHPLERVPDPQTYDYALTVARALQSGLVHPALAGITEFRTAGTPPPVGMSLVGTFGGNSFYR